MSDRELLESMARMTLGRETLRRVQERNTLSEDEAIELLSSSVTFAENFFSVAATHLRPGGVFTYLTNEIDSLGRAHQRLLFEHFSDLRLQRVPLTLPSDVRDAWWADSMVVIAAVK